MNPESDSSFDIKSKKLTDLFIRLGAVILLAILCYRVFSPFLGLVVWAIILAVSLFPLHQLLAKRLGGKQGRTSTLMVLGLLLVVGIPTVFLASAQLMDSQDAHNSVLEQQVSIPAPQETVQDWPVVGEQIYKVWNEAATNFEMFKQDYAPQIEAVSQKLLDMATAAVGAAALFFASFVVAGIMMAYAKPGTQATENIFVRFAGSEKGPELHQLSVGTVRSVAMGVVGVAFFQAILFGIGFVMAGIPLPGILALLVLLTGIAQVPALLFGLPAIAYVWMGGGYSTLVNILLTLFFVVASLADNVLKPMLLGRGVKTPLPVVLMGALGGMFTAGLVGLFLGAVLLSLGYQIFMNWLDEETKSEAAESPAIETSESSPDAG